MDWKPLVYGLAILLFIGALIVGVTSPFYTSEEIEEETGEWITPFETVAVGLWNFLEYVVRFASWIIGVVVNIFRTIGGTGAGILGLIGFDIDLDFTYTDEMFIIEDIGIGHLEGEYLRQEHLDTEDYNVWSKSTFFSVKSIHFYHQQEEFFLLNPRFFFDDITYYEGEFSNENIEFTATQDAIDEGGVSSFTVEVADFEEHIGEPDEIGGIEGFFEQGRTQISDSVKTVGLIPSAIGLPFMFVLMLAILLGIIKIVSLVGNIIPFT